MTEVVGGAGTGTPAQPGEPAPPGEPAQPGEAAQPNPIPSSSRRRPGRLALVGGIAMSFGLAGIAAAWAQAPVSAGSHAEIRIHYSQFGPTEVVAKAGIPITIVLVNADPIDHEWLVGDEAFHESHRTGTEQHHGDRPTEVSIPAGTTATTTITLQQPGEYRFICHLPGHEAYGMVGILRVLPAT